MADKITKFEDYKKKDNADDIDIQIEDPYNFFNEQEREEYFQERQKELQKEEEPEPERREERVKEDNDREDRANKRDRRREDHEPDYEDEEYDDEEPEDEETGGGFPIELFIRISSIITGIVILAFRAIVVKVKVFDKYFVPDPDEEPTVEASLALPAGYTEKNDTVKVTAKSLNLRTVASSESDATIVTAVSEGTELKRIAVSEDEKWALVEYEGSRVYASMKYLSVKE